MGIDKEEPVGLSPDRGDWRAYLPKNDKTKSR